MAKKSISDIVLRAVVDTSGVAAGLNNIGSQVSGRSFGQSGGGPTGASGAAGGFVNPHGGGAGPGVAATAAAAAAGAAVGRAGGRGNRAMWADAQAGFESATGRRWPGFRWSSAYPQITSGPTANFIDWAMRRRIAAARDFRERTSSWNAAMAGNPGDATRSYNRMQRARAVEGLWARSPNWIRQGVLNAPWRAREMAGGLSGMGDRIGSFTQRTLDRGGPLGGLTRFAGLMGMGRFAGVGGFGLAAGAPVAAAAMAYGGYQSRYSSSQDITRFNFGADRQTAMAQRNYWRQGVGSKAPLGLADRFWLGAYRENNNQAPWMDKFLMASGGVGGMAEATGARMASWGTLSGFVKEVTMYNTVDSLVQFGRRLFN